LENTHNGASGVVTTVEETEAIVAIARARGLPVHLDGARLWNAAAALGVPEARLAAPADTVMVAFSKGLGAPVGAALAGDAPVIAEARVVRKRLGGGMRQSGVLAAAALHGLERHRARLGDDHARARALAARVDGVSGARVVPPDTNIVMIDLPEAVASDVAARTGAAGVRVSAWTDARLRCVTHLDVDDAAIARASDVIAEAIAAALVHRAAGGESSDGVPAYGALLR
jgi:threonine aldolase